MSDILRVGITGLNAYQSLLGTAADNVANSATEGFRRRTTELKTRPSVFIGGQLVGTGVAVGVTKRVVDEVQQSIHRENLSSYNQFAGRANFSEQVNDLLSNTSTGVSEAINKFFTALRQLSNKAADSNHREVLLNESIALAKKITTMDRRFKDLVTDANAQMQEVVKEINSIASSIVTLNKDIMTSSNQQSFSEPNNLLDQRDQLLDRLSELVQVDTINLADGTVNIFIGNGQALVIGAQQMELAAILNPDDPTKIDVQDVSGASRIITADMVGGKIGGLRSIREEIIDFSQTQLDRIVMSLAMTINAQHKLGIDLNGDFGLDYFTDYNDYTLQLQRSIPDNSNIGDAKFLVSIDEIRRPSLGSCSVYSDASNLVDVATLSQLATANLNINSNNIRATVAGDDTVSTVDNACSAIAIAKAINDSVGAIGITAKAEINALYLGTFTAGAFAAGQFEINGTNIISTGADEATLLRDINAQTATTGVQAVGNGKITLVANDGRNIQLTTDGAGTGTFQYFAANGAAALDKVQRAAVSVQQPGSAITIAGTNPGNAGFTAGTTPPASSSLTDSDYQLAYDGTNYKLTRLSDNTIVATTTGTVLQGDGFTINLGNGTAVAGDKFLIRPTTGGAESFALKIDNYKKLAMASPISVNKTVAQANSTAKITRGKIINASGVPASTANVLGNAFGNAGKLSPPIRIEFFNDSQGQPTIYRVFDMTNGGSGVQIGPDQVYDPTISNEIFPLAAVTDATAPGPNKTYVYDPGYRVAISGDPIAGDIFTINYNSKAPGDNGNAEEFRNLQDELLLSDNTCSYQGAYNNLIASVGSIASTDGNGLTATESLCNSSKDNLQKQLGVNLNEEAINIIRYQQGYMAAAQVIAIGRTLFDSLLAAVAA